MIDQTIAPELSRAATDIGQSLAPAAIDQSEGPLLSPSSPSSPSSLESAAAPPARAAVSLQGPSQELAPEVGVAHGGLAPGRFLAAVVSNEEPEATRLESLNAVLDSFGRARFVNPPHSDASIPARLRQRGLAVLSFESPNLEALRSLNHPALLRVAGDDHRTRVLALMKLEGNRAYLYGLSGGGPLRVPLEELERQWRGGAWVVWNDFEDVRPVMGFGEKGSSVEWLQKSLAELGYYDGETSGLFDRSTFEGLRAFQQVRQLQVDGLAGPRTRMVLYDLLDGYQIPRLVERGSRSEDAG
jgi:hypothetical protein